VVERFRLCDISRGCETHAREIAEHFMSGFVAAD
jgi:hypothetical protein